MPISIACHQCAALLLRYPSAIKTHVFCNKECRRAFIKRPLEERFWGFVQKTETCWLWTGAKDKKGRGKFSTEPLPNNPRRYRLELAYRVAWKLMHGVIPDDQEVCHDCPGGDNPSCVNPAHLWLGTQADNIRDAFMKGTLVPPVSRSGAQHPRAKLTWDKAQSLRERYAHGDISVRQLSVDFEVSPSLVRGVLRGEYWNIGMCTVDELDASVPRTPPASSRTGAGWCPLHQVQMRQTTKEGRSWWWHKVGEQFCKGEGVR